MHKDLVIKKIENLVKELKLKVEIKHCKIENSFLILDLLLKPNGTFNKIERHSTEIALALKSLTKPLIYPITEKGIIRMELMISELETVYFNDIIQEGEFINSLYKLPLILGKCRDGELLIIDLCEMPHLLIAGSTGSGKSVLLQSLINSLLVSNRDMQFALIDPKRVEFSYYNNLDNLYCSIAKDTDSSINLLNNLMKEMNNRFHVLEKHNCRNIFDYKDRMPFIVVVIDELADLLMSSKKVSQELICRLAQKSRACGIHLIIATQRPSVDVVTGLIKANFPARISCRVSSYIDSRTILDRNGAENLGSNGDAIIDCSSHSFKRFKGAFINEKQIIENMNRNSNWWKKLWKF